MRWINPIWKSFLLGEVVARPKKAGAEIEVFWEHSKAPRSRAIQRNLSNRQPLWDAFRVGRSVTACPPSKGSARITTVELLLRQILVLGLSLCLCPGLASAQAADRLVAEREALFQAWQQAVQARDGTTASRIQAELIPYERSLYKLSRTDPSMDEKVYAGSLIYALNGVAAVRRARGKHGESADLLAEAFTVLKNFLPEGHWQLTDARQKWEKDVRLSALTTRELDGLKEADQLMKEVEERFSRGDLSALPLAESALRTRQTLLGDASIDTVQSLAYVGLIQKNRGDLAAAREAYENAIAICERHLGIHPDTARMCTNLGKLHQQAGDFVLAEPLLTRAHEIKRAIRGPAHPDTTASLQALAELYGDFGDPHREGVILTRLLPLQMQAAGASDPSVAAVHSNLGLVRKAEGDFLSAEKHYLAAAAILEKQDVPTDRNADYATVLNNLGELYRATGDWSRASSALERAFRIKREVLGENHPETAAVLNNLGSVAFEKGDLDHAEALYRDAFRIKSAAGAAPASRANALDNLGTVCFARGDDAAAARFCREALYLREKHLGDHLDTARSLNNLALIAGRRGSPEEAIAHLESACEMVEKIHGEAHPHRVRFLDNLARIQSAAGRTEAAVATMDRCRKASRHLLYRIFPGLPEDRQLTFLSMRDRPSLDFGLSLVLENPSFVTEGAEWVLNGKAITVEVTALRPRYAGGELDDTARRLELTRTRLAGLTLKQPQEMDDDTYRNKRNELRELERRLLMETAPEVKTVAEWISLDTLRQRIPQQTALVEYIRFERTPPEGGDGVPYYAAWIVRGEESPLMIDLGAAARIDELVSALRQEMEQSPRRISEEGEASAVAIFREKADPLADRCLVPVIDQLGDDCSELLIGPDSNLWLVPWSALPLSDGRYAIERYGIGIVETGRQLVEDPSPGQSPASAAALFADPDFDLGGDSGQTENAPNRRAPSEELPAFGRLPGTAREAEAIQPLLEKLASRSLDLYLGADARESRFKQLVRPEYLVFSTHGFFLPPPPRENRSREEVSLMNDLWDESFSSTNPLLRCGLTLAGCNRNGEGGEDGILTGLEILSRDLRGTRLVVLSACFTVLGWVLHG